MARLRRLSNTLFVTVFFSLLFSSNYLSRGISQSLKEDEDVKVHSRLFSGNEEGTIPQKLLQTNGTLTVTSSSDNEGLGIRSSEAPPYPPQRLVSLACHDDAIVIATSVKRVSHMTSDQAFVYSDWTMRVQEVLQDSSRGSIAGKDSIQVVRPGGVLSLDGRTVYGKAIDFPEFKENTRYLIFLNFIPETGAYKVTTGHAFDLSANLDQRKVENDSNSSQYERTESNSAESLVKNTKAAIASAASSAFCEKERAK